MLQIVQANSNSLSLSKHIMNIMIMQSFLHFLRINNGVIIFLHQEKYIYNVGVLIRNDI